MENVIKIKIDYKKNDQPKVIDIVNKLSRIGFFVEEFSECSIKLRKGEADYKSITELLDFFVKLKESGCISWFSYTREICHFINTVERVFDIYIEIMYAKNLVELEEFLAIDFENL